MRGKGRVVPIKREARHGKLQKRRGEDGGGEGERVS